MLRFVQHDGMRCAVVQQRPFRTDLDIAVEPKTPRHRDMRREGVELDRYAKNLRLHWRVRLRYTVHEVESSSAHFILSEFRLDRRLLPRAGSDQVDLRQGRAEPRVSAYRRSPASRPRADPQANRLLRRPVAGPAASGASPSTAACARTYVFCRVR